jgi:DedD protein
MEQKKLLLVAISVGVFLVIVIGAAMLAFGPGNSVSSAAMAAVPGNRPIPAGIAGTFPENSSAAGQAFSPAGTPAAGETVQRTPADTEDLLKNPAAVPGLQTAPGGAPLQQNNFYINGSPEKLPSEEAESAQTVITVAPKTAAGVPDAAPEGRAVSQSSGIPAETRSRPAGRAQTPAAKPAAKPAETRSRPAGRAQAPAVKPAAAPPAQARPAQTAARTPERARTYDDYWVQTGSFSAKARAEGVKETLASKGIASIIENREVEGKTFFRVRVGPYTSQNEADYWLSLIKSLSGFEDSQVWKTRR